MGTTESAGIRALDYDELGPELQDALRARYERLGYLGDFFRFGAHQPAAMLAFNEFTESLKDALPHEISETVALTVASALGNAYERHQHERLAVKLGIDREVVAALVGRDPEPANLTEAQRAVRRLARAGVATSGHGCKGLLADVVALLGQDQAVGVLLLVARYSAHALVANALEIEPPVPSIFARATPTGEAAGRG